MHMFLSMLCCCLFVDATGVVSAAIVPSGHSMSFKGCCVTAKELRARKMFTMLQKENTDCAMYLMKSDECLAVLTSNIPKTP